MSELNPTPSTDDELEQHHWRAYGQPDGTVVCDAEHNCNIAADVNALLASEKQASAESMLHKVADELSYRISRGDIDMVHINLEQLLSRLRNTKDGE